MEMSEDISAALAAAATMLFNQGGRPSWIQVDYDVYQRLRHWEAYDRGHMGSSGTRRLRRKYGRKARKP